MGYKGRNTEEYAQDSILSPKGRNTEEYTQDSILSSKGFQRRERKVVSLGHRIVNCVSRNRMGGK